MAFAVCERGVDWLIDWEDYGRVVSGAVKT